MKRFLVGAGAAAALLASVSCLKVVHEIDHVCDGGVIVVQGQTVHAQVLVALDLSRASANLVGTYGDLIHGLASDLAGTGISVDELAILPLYGEVHGAPALVYGASMSGGGGANVSAVLAAASTSGFFDAPLPGVTAEQYNLATIARRLDTATLPAELTTGQSRPFYSPPRDLFLVVTIQPGKRLCAEASSACALGGAPPVTAFSTAAMDGTAAWLKLPGGSYPSGRVFQVFITTSETESPADFHARCSAIAGFPKTLLDVMQPSPVVYYNDLAAGLGAKSWHAEQADLCDLLGSDGGATMKALAKRIAQSLAGK